jgi:hypothetical protein
MRMNPVPLLAVAVGVKVAGVKKQAAFAGNPEQLRLTVEAKPPTAV